MQTIQNYINGELVAPVNQNYLDNYEPATGEIYSQLPESDTDDLELAVKAASSAQNEWANMPAEQRSIVLMKLADAI